MEGGQPSHKVWIDREATLTEVSQLVASNIQYSYTDSWTITGPERANIKPEVELRAYIHRDGVGTQKWSDFKPETQSYRNKTGNMGA